MNVLSLFDGMSCGQIALERAGIKVDNYFASEIDKYAIQVTQANYPNTVQLGDVTNVFARDLPKIDLIIGGSPCQGFSRAGKGLNFEDPRSKLFFEYVRLLKEINPKNFLLENVSMKVEYRDIISKHLGVQPILINSNLLSAQNRKRFYWTNISNIIEPYNKHIYLKDILEDKIKNPLIFQLAHGANKGGIKATNGKTPSMTSSCWQYNNLLILDKHNSKNGLECVGGLLKNKKWLDNGKNLQRNFSQGERIYSVEGKSPTLSASSGGTAGVGNALITDDIRKRRYRKLTPIECERLQTLPDNYTKGVSNTQRYKMLGNGWTVDIIAHILKGLIQLTEIASTKEEKQ